MSLIKDNPFAVILGGSTLAAVGGLLWFAFSNSSRYDEALARFQQDKGDVDRTEKGALYPTQSNLNQKIKLLADHRVEVTKLQETFKRFRTGELNNVTSQEFTDHLKATDAALRKEFDQAGTKLPAAFLFGFESYSGGLAKENSTGILGYQLDALGGLFSSLAKAKPSEIRSVYRPKLEEEDEKKWSPGADDIARPLPVEIVFKGREDAMRKFLTSLAVADKYYYVVRSLAVSNEKQDAPNSKDAHFEEHTKPAANPASPFGDVVLPGPGADSPFGGPAPAVPATTPAAPAGTPAKAAGAKPATATPAGAKAAAAIPVVPEVPAAPATPAPTDSSRILKQVLGSEEVIVFLRIDILKFLPEKTLPEIK